MVLTLKESYFVLESPPLTDEESRPEGVSYVIDPFEPVAIFLHSVKYLTRSEGYSRNQLTNSLMVSLL